MMAIFLEKSNQQSTRDKILMSALILFVEKGFFKTSITDLVKHSGISNGSIYHQFNDKQQVAEALMEELISYVENQQASILKTQSTAWDCYYNLTQWLLQAAIEQPHMMQFILKAQHQEFLPDNPPICSSKPFLNLRDVIQDGMHKGEIKQMDLMVASSIAFGGPLRLIQLGLDGLLERPINDYLEEITQTAWLALKTEQQKASPAS